MAKFIREVWSRIKYIQILFLIGLSIRKERHTSPFFFISQSFTVFTDFMNHLIWLLLR